MKAAIITIGDEILIGQTLDSNSHFMAKMLNKNGIAVTEMITVADIGSHIKEGLDFVINKVDLVLMTGGLGPTKDDITKNTLAEYFNSEMELHPDILELLEEYYKKRERQISEEAKTLAILPQKAQLIKNTKGTAAAMWFEENGKIVVSMPGVPHEMRNFMESEIMPRLRMRGVGKNIFYKTIMIAGYGETIIANKIADIENSLPKNFKLSYLPNLGVLKLRLTATGNDENTIYPQLNDLIKHVVNRLPKAVFADYEISLEEYLKNLFISKKMTLSTAESCTGGYISHKITSIAGSSGYYNGSIISYSNEIKMEQLGVKADTLTKNGAVSEATVIEMAHGAIKQLNTDVAVSVSGVAGPSGGSEEKPVGTVWVCVANKNRHFTKKLQLTPSRDVNIRLAANLALNMVRLFVEEKI